MKSVREYSEQLNGQMLEITPNVYHQTYAQIVVSNNGTLLTNKRMHY